MKLSKADFFPIYNYLKSEVNFYIKNNNLKKALYFIEMSAKAAYNFNFFYKDDSLESSLTKISSLLDLKKYDTIIPVKDRCVLIDTCGTDNHGLTQQYIRAFISADIEFAYVYEDLNLDKIKIILQELKNYPKATIFTFDKDYDYVERIKLLYNFIIKYRPEKYFMHIMPWDVVGIVICNLLKGIVRFNINATDHAFWLGSSCIEYCIEFRDYGFTVSNEKRGLRYDQLLKHPYYPILNKIPFKGFPNIIPNDSVIIFSGGAYYKIYGESGLYFELVNNILSENPKAVLIFAGTGDDTIFRNLIKKNKLEKRVFLLGSRTDISEVFNNCDIYLSTYPITGGLMGQFAAVIGKPILSFSDKKLSSNLIESFICHQEKYTITFNNLDLFYEYAKQLCSNKDFRVKEGLKLQKCVISEYQFNNEFKYILNYNKSLRNAKVENINYNDFEQVYLEVENKFGQNLQKFLFLQLRLKTIFFPKVFFNIIIILAKKILIKFTSIKNYFNILKYKFR